MPTDTEDPNIATLREALMEAGGRQRAYAAISALAATLAERDRRIAELELRLKDTQVCLVFEQAACSKAQQAADAAVARVTVVKSPGEDDPACGKYYCNECGSELDDGEPHELRSCIHYLHDLVEKVSARGAEPPAPAPGARDEDGNDVNIHRDATWRPASAAPVKGEASGFPHRFAENMSNALREPEPDSAWLKRTVEELTTARPVEVTMQPGGMLWFIEAAGRRIPMGSAPVETRDRAWLASILAHHDLPKRDAKPAEPSPQPGGFLDAVNAKLREHSERIEAGVDALKDTENGLGGAIGALTRRVELAETALLAQGYKLAELEALINAKPKSP